MNRTILVSGGNRGIGLAIVHALAKSQKDRVLLGCRDLSSGKSEADTAGPNVTAVPLDLSTKVATEDSIEAIKAEYPHIHVLINNAAVLNEGDPLDISWDDFEEAMQVNVYAPYQLIRAVAPGMIANQYGRIVNLSSGWGAISDGLTGPFSYSFTKANINALTITMARSLPASVKINSMCPGWVKTRMGGSAAPRTPEEGADTAIFLANLDDDGPTGKFFRDRKPIDW